MLPGYNHNVKYKGLVYHVQTEDSGVENPHVITHLFVGGNIIVSKKTGYTEMVNKPNMNETLQALMQDQHKNMLKGLIHGQFDNEISVRSAGAKTLDGPAPLNVEAGAQHRSSLGVAGAAVAVASKADAPAAASGGGGLLDSEAQVIEADALQAAFDSKDENAVDSIFGNLISENPLDKVILAYLAGDKQP